MEDRSRTASAGISSFCHLPGQVTEMLPPYFRNVIGTDPSKGMIEQARELARTSKYSSQLEFAVCPAEEASSQVEPSSVDLVTAGQSLCLNASLLVHKSEGTISDEFSVDRSGRTLV